jgi:hypothetical protein
MRHEKNRLLRAIAAQPCDDGGTERRGPQELRLDSSRTQHAEEILRQRQLVPGWIGRVEADQRAEMLDCLDEQRAVARGLSGRGQRAVGRG